MRKAAALSIVLLSAVLFRGYGQEEASAGQTSNVEADLSASSTDASRNIMLARSTAEYRVTPGDVYTLAYAAGSTPVTYIITVDSSYRLRVSNLGTVSGAGKTFPQVRTEVEAIVSRNYPLSGVQLVLTQPAVFTVFVKGEVQVAREVNAWGLSRLSSLLGGNQTPRTSQRNIMIRSGNGTERTYDLFRARRDGDLSQDPYLRPGDVITFQRVSRVVNISGAVERPGRYQLLPGENLRALIENYAQGYTPTADLGRMRLVRYVESSEISGDVIFLSLAEAASDYVLQDYDVVTVPAVADTRPAVPVNRTERHITIQGAVRRPGDYELLPDENLKALIEIYADGFTPVADPNRIELTRYVESRSESGDRIHLTGADVEADYGLQHFDQVVVSSIIAMRPVIFVEGAVRASEDGTELESSNRLIVQYNRGEDYAALVRRNRVWFSAVSDTANAYVIRSDERILLDLNPMLYDTEFRSVLLVEENDRLLVPFRQFFVTVAGAVQTPGRYPYIPDRGWAYYVGLAGGFVPGRNTGESIDITDMQGGRHNKTWSMEPETTITARTNHPLYIFNQMAPVLTTVLSLVSTVISVFLLVSR